MNARAAFVQAPWRKTNTFVSVCFVRSFASQMTKIEEKHTHTHKRQHAIARNLLPGTRARYEILWTIEKQI